MGPALYVIAILGCGEAETSCEQVALANEQFASVEACTMAADDALGRFQDVAFPVVVAQCQRAGAAAAEVTPAEVQLPAPGSAPVRALPASYPMPSKARG